MGSPVSQGILVLTGEESCCWSVQGILHGHCFILSLGCALGSSQENRELQIETVCILAEQPVFKSWQGSDKLKVKVGNLCFQVSSSLFI